MNNKSTKFIIIIITLNIDYVTTSSFSFFNSSINIMHDHIVLVVLLRHGAGSDYNFVITTLVTAVSCPNCAAALCWCGYPLTMYNGHLDQKLCDSYY